ncbi:hypothetical protein FRC06_009262 [Ceratobasidium sp. 370]|nr:hypothetical protein FRC06_009262 [Ceratobasidium sp. 370]
MAATKENPIIFYDLVGKDGISWSPNTYKTRVEMLSFPDIQAKYKELGMTSTAYTLPLIADPSSELNGKPTYVSDSFKIAVYLDDKYPAPRYPLVFPPGTRALQHLLVTQYWYRTRGDRFKPLPEDVASKMWQEVAQKWDAFGKSLEFNNNTAEAGPFIMGNQVTFVDFAVGGVFHFFKQIEGEDSTRLEEMMQWQEGKWKALRNGILSIEKSSSGVA